MKKGFVIFYITKAMQSIIGPINIKEPLSKKRAICIKEPTDIGGAIGIKSFIIIYHSH